MKWFNGLSNETRGILLFVTATFLFSIMDVIARWLTQRYDPVQVVWARYASQTGWAFLIASPWLATLLRTRHIGLQILRSILLFGATAAFFTSFRYLQLAESMAIFQVSPLIITILAFAVLGEKIGPRRWFGVAAGLVGALIIIRPGADVFSWAAFLPLVAACCFAGYSIATRFLGDEESPWTAFLYTALFGAITATVLVPFVWITPTPTDGVVMALFGILGGIGHFLIIVAFSRTEASAVAPFIYSGLIYGTFWGFAVFDEIPDLWTILGALVIVIAGLYVWRRERLRAA